MAVIAACGDNEQSPPAPASTSTPAAGSAAGALTSPPTVGNEGDVQAVLEEVRAAHGAAQEVLTALERAPKEGSWAGVQSACDAYPEGAQQYGADLPSFEGLHTTSRFPHLWPKSYVAIDSTAATACFVAIAARGIPPGARIDPAEPTTAQIIAQPLASALDEAGEASPQELRILIEQQR
jgi:hypothetical protein